MRCIILMTFALVFQESAAQVEMWTEGKQYATNDIVRHQQKLVRCAEHTLSDFCRFEPGTPGGDIAWREIAGDNAAN